jgi:hypothetical protein
MDVVSHGWSVPTLQHDAAKTLTAKFKNPRRVLKAWQSQISSLNTNIANLKSILLFMGILEEFRDLTVLEFNFRVVLIEKYVSLLHQQQVYWKQRGTIKWVKFGNEGTKFFHANATIKHRRNLISSLKDPSGSVHYDHQTKENILWDAFKERLGTSDSPEMMFNLEQLLNRADNLEWLSDPFSMEEIDAVVASLPSDKSPGPDAFNTDFVKKCWPLIIFDFHKLCEDFHAGNICLQSLNGSHITLLSKVDSPTRVSDYRPISLLNT